MRIRIHWGALLGNALAFLLLLLFVAPSAQSTPVPTRTQPAVQVQNPTGNAEHLAQLVRADLAHPIAATAGDPVPPPDVVEDSPDNIGPRAWDRSTIVIQVMKGGTSAENTWFHERVSYYRAVAGSTLNIVEGSCQVNMPCIRVYWDFYGVQTWDGLTTEAYTGCLAVNKWCRYDGTNSAVTHTTIQFDRSNGIDARTPVGLQHLSCHELGRAIAELTAAAGATCMSSNYAYPKLLASEEASVRTKYSGLPRLAPTRTDYELAG